MKTSYPFVAIVMPISVPCMIAKARSGSGPQVENSSAVRDGHPA